MGKLAKHRVLIAGLFSPILAILLYAVVYGGLTAQSSNPEQDWLFRLSVSTAVMTVPFLVTVWLAMRDIRRKSLLASAKVGLAIAVLSLGLTWKPVNDGVLRSKQTRNQAMRDIAAPLFDTQDIRGARQSLEEQRGKVVLVNIWATWCGPCRAEMPKLDKLYLQKRSQGFVVFGISNEDTATQQRFLQQVPVNYPLLTLNGNVPALYRDIARYPAIFLIDRQGRLQPAPEPEKPFATLEAAVNVLLNDKPN